MNGFLGADVEAVRGHAEASRRASETLRTLLGRCEAMVQATEWIGADADSFRARWSGEVAPRLERAAHGLETDGRELDAHAEEQESASGTGTAGSGAGGTAGGILGLGLAGTVAGLPTAPESPIGRVIAKEPPALIENWRPTFPHLDPMICDVTPRDLVPREILRPDLSDVGEIIRCFVDPAVPTWPTPVPLPDVQPLPIPDVSPLPDLRPLPIPDVNPLPDLTPRPLPDIAPLPAPIPDAWPLPQPLPAPLPAPDPWPFPEPLPRLDVHRI